MRCMICGDELNMVEKEHDHLFVTKNNKDKHIHVHGDLGRKEAMKEMIESAMEHTGVSMNGSALLDKKEIVFHNRQRIGDIIMFTCGVRDFKKAFPNVRVNVISTAEHIWDYSPYVDRTLVPTEENTLKIGPGRLTNASNRLDWHFANAYRMSIEDALRIHIPQGESRGDIWLSEEEYNAPRVFEHPYWIICTTGEKSWGCKTYPHERWQEFVDQNSDIMFVQIGASEDNATRLQGANVIDYIGKTQDKQTGIRDLFKLFLNAEGSISLVSFAMHLSGALFKPAIVVAGAREPVSFTQYPGHRYLATDGCLPCSVNACWHCDLKNCSSPVAFLGRNIPKCVDMISPSNITDALHSYYVGGRLFYDKPSAKPKLTNIVKNPPKPISTPAYKSDVTSNKFGMEFGGRDITESDWVFIKETIQKYKIKTILEFGCGLATLLMNDLGVEVESFDNDEARIAKVLSLNPKAKVSLWDGVTEDIYCKDSKFDMAFVDGPAGGRNRETSFRLAIRCSDIVMVHDAHREFEMEWQNEYLYNKWVGPEAGGKRCHLWFNKSCIVLEQEDVKPSDIPSEVKVNIEGLSTFEAIEKLNNLPDFKDPLPRDFPTITALNKKFIKIVSTARGWGGCARSVCTIMKFLQNAGHQVEFIPFRNSVSSNEFKDYIKKYLPNITVTENYETVSEHCDIFFMYADDYVWEFAKPEIADVFSYINADRKIMMLNYRRGGVGEIEWTKGCDKYMFLCSQQEKELLSVLPNVKTKVLPPCTELEEFLKIKPDYGNGLRIVRHNSQGDTKFAPNFDIALEGVLGLRTDSEVHMLPGPSFIPERKRFYKYPRTSNAEEIAKFLSKGNLFWYCLPPGYMDMGPRVILEAMAAGLPVIADNWGGAPDRVSPLTGWICDNIDGQLEVIRNVTSAELEAKGKQAKEVARNEFVPEKWIKEIVDA